MSTTLSTAADIAAASQTIGLLGLLVAGAICAARLHYVLRVAPGVASATPGDQVSHLMQVDAEVGQ